MTRAGGAAFLLALSTLSALGGCARKSAPPAARAHVDLSRAYAAPGPPRDSVRPGFEGYFDTADCRFVHGWVWDSRHPDAIINVDLFDDETLLVTLPAATLRKDLQQAGKGDGQHAFDLAVPAALKDGKPHLLRARISGTPGTLVNSPKTITCR